MKGDPVPKIKGKERVEVGVWLHAKTLSSIPSTGRKRKRRMRRRTKRRKGHPEEAEAHRAGPLSSEMWVFCAWWFLSTLRLRAPGWS